MVLIGQALSAEPEEGVFGEREEPPPAATEAPLEPGSKPTTADMVRVDTLVSNTSAGADVESLSAQPEDDVLEEQKLPSSAATGAALEPSSASPFEMSSIYVESLDLSMEPPSPSDRRGVDHTTIMLQSTHELEVLSAAREVEGRPPVRSRR